MILSSRRIAQLASAVHSGPERTVTSVSVDSRTLAEGALYVALRGGRVDGHSFVKEAVDRGAAALLVEKDQLARTLEATSARAAVIACDDCASALRRFASLYAAGMRSCTGIAVTGSCGKTTTKEMVASILSVCHSVASTPGNLNSTIGLPLSVLTMEEGDEYAVFEMGIDHVGEMDELVSVFPPQIAAVTNIGLSHLASFGSMAATAREKGRIFLPQTQGFILDDNPFGNYFRSLSPAIETVSNPFGLVEDLGLDGIRLRLGREDFVMPTFGMHNVKDASLAVAICRHLGLDDWQMAQGLSTLKPLFGRSRVMREGRLTVIEDCYNASLDSVSDAIASLSRLSWKGDKLIVLGDMRELGSACKDAHRKVGQVLGKADCDHIFLYGEAMEEAYRVLYDMGESAKVVYTDSFSVLSQSLRKETKRGDLVLLKGSRAMAMERLHDVLREVS